MKTVRQFMLNKFPPNEYIDCHISSGLQELMREYAEECVTYVKSVKDAEIAELKEKLSVHITIYEQQVKDLEDAKKG